MTQKNQANARRVVRNEGRPNAGKIGTVGSVDTRNPDWKSYVPEGHGQSDEQIRADVQEKLSGQRDLGATSTALAIVVAEGVVTLQGEVASRGVQQQLIELIRSVPSVKEVDSKLRVVAQ